MKRSIIFLLALAVSTTLSAQVFLTSFGSDDFIDYSTPALVQTSTTGHFEGDPMFDQLSGDFFSGPVDITGVSSALALTATVFESPNVGFSIQLFDIDLNSYRYDGVWFDFTTGAESTVILNAQAGQTGPFDFTQVIGLDFAFDSLSGSTLNVTLRGLSAVPEPSTYAVLAGLVCLGYVVVRRRRRTA